MATVSSDRSSIIRIGFARDAQGNFGPGSTIPANVGDSIELAFSDVVGIGKLADLDVSVRGDSVSPDGVRDVVNIAGGHRIIGSFELNAVLRAVQPGRSVVDIVVISPNGSAAGIVALVVEVV